MAKKYKLERVVADLAWDAFVASSEAGTVFSTSAYLTHTGCRLGLYHCYNANELRAAVAVLESRDGVNVIMDDFVIYGGIFFGSPMTGQNQSQRISEQFDLATFIVGALSSLYQNISFALAPSISDIRPFLWHNYGGGYGRYSVDVRYTSYLEIADHKSGERLENMINFTNASVARRQQIRYAIREGVITEPSENVGVFIDFYRMTMLRQGETVSAERISRMAELVSGLLKVGIARMYVSCTKEGDPGSMAIFTFDNKRAYYLFGANDPAHRNTPVGTAVLWDAFHLLSREGINQIDLEGVNSPRRGWFKLSFGGSLIPYYEVKI